MEEIARLKHVNEELVYRCINQTARKHGITEEMCLKVILNALEPKRKKDETGKTISNKANDEDASYTSKRGRKHHSEWDE